MGLKLSRKPGESVRLIDNRHGTEITVTICDRSGGNVELLFEAPQYVKVLRAELTPETPPLGALNNPELPAARWRDNSSGRKFAKKGRR